MDDERKKSNGSDNPQLIAKPAPLFGQGATTTAALQEQTETMSVKEMIELVAPVKKAFEHPFHGRIAHQVFGIPVIYDKLIKRYMLLLTEEQFENLIKSGGTTKETS